MAAETRMLSFRKASSALKVNSVVMRRTCGYGVGGVSKRSRVRICTNIGMRFPIRFVYLSHAPCRCRGGRGGPRGGAPSA